VPNIGPMLYNVFYQHRSNIYGQKIYGYGFSNGANQNFISETTAN